VLALSSPLSRRTDSCTVCKPRLSCDARSPDAGVPPASRLASKSRHHDSSPKGHIHESGLRGFSRVSRPSSCYSSTAIWTCCQSTPLQTSYMDMLSVYASADHFCRPVIPSNVRGVSVTDGGPLNSASKTPCFYFRCLLIETVLIIIRVSSVTPLVSSHVPRLYHPR